MTETDTVKRLAVAVTAGRTGRFRLYFREEDVRAACGKLACGDNPDSCMKLMQESRLSCPLCRAVLDAMKKRPAEVRFEGPAAEGPGPEPKPPCKRPYNDGRINWSS